MPSQSNPNHKRSITTIQGVPMSIFNPQLIEEVGKASTTEYRISTTYGDRSGGNRHSRRSHQRAVSESVSASSPDASKVARAIKVRRSMSEHHSFKHRTAYIRPVGPELVSIKQPSCTGLPPSWTSMHDRFITYLATHAPLDKNGRIQRGEESRERWRSEDIASLVMERFEELDGCIKIGMIENRLALLDQAGDNDYFKMSYGVYKHEPWGRGI